MLILYGSLIYRTLRSFKKMKCPLFEVFAVSAILLMGVMYVDAYANYGLIARTKIMAMPFVYVLMVRGFSKSGKA